MATNIVAVDVAAGPGSTVSGVVIQSGTFPLADMRKLSYIMTCIIGSYPAYTVSAVALRQSILLYVANANVSNARLFS